MMHSTTEINTNQPTATIAAGPLAEVTAAVLSQGNVQRSRKSQIQALRISTPELPDPVAASSRHNPYSPVLPPTPEEMVRVQREREYKEMFRAMGARYLSTPASVTQSPVTPFYGYYSFPSTPVSLTPTGSFRQPSPVQFFDEPMPARAPSPLAPQPPIAPIASTERVTGTNTNPQVPTALNRHSSAPVLKKVYENGRPVARVADEKEKEAQPQPTPIHPEASKYVRIAASAGEHTYRLKDRVIVGDYVIVDGDRGIDLGRVVGVAAEGTESVGEVQRPANPDEIASLSQLRSDEASALEYVQQQALRLLGPKFHATRVAFQFDREKLTVWYRSAERVYFVPLNKTLNQQYKCRIWMIREGEEETTTA